MDLKFLQKVNDKLEQHAQEQGTPSSTESSLDTGEASSSTTHQPPPSQKQKASPNRRPPAPTNITCEETHSAFNTPSLSEQEADDDEGEMTLFDFYKSMVSSEK